MRYYIMNNGKEIQLVAEYNLYDKEFLEDVGSYKNTRFYESEIDFKSDFEATKFYIQNKKNRF